MTPPTMELELKPTAPRPAHERQAGPTLEAIVLGAWEELNCTGSCACPVCGGRLEPSGCLACGSRLS